MSGSKSDLGETIRIKIGIAKFHWLLRGKGKLPDILRDKLRLHKDVRFRGGLQSSLCHVQPHVYHRESCAFCKELKRYLFTSDDSLNVEDRPLGEGPLYQGDRNSLAN